MVKMGSLYLPQGLHPPDSSSTTNILGVNYNLLYFPLRFFLFLVYLSIGLYFRYYLLILDLSV